MKDLNYYKNNCEEDYIKTPISVLRYITELEKKNEAEQLTLSGVGSSNDKKDQIINKEYIIVDSKDGLWDVYDTNGCLGTGLNNEEVNRVTRK
tara:strand:+ start:208 stop:486 length:279 start_codon:yes stop_codon:yes gene_type:complete